MKKKLNIKIGGYLFILLGIGNTFLVTIDKWFFLKKIFAQKHLFGVLHHSSALFEHSISYTQGNAVLGDYLYGWMILAVGALSAWVERQLDRPVPIFLPLLLIVIFNIDNVFITPFSVYVDPQITGLMAWIYHLASLSGLGGTYICLYMILCNILDRRAKQLMNKET